MKIKILICNSCQKEIETKVKCHTHKCCGHRMHISEWRFE